MKTLKTIGIVLGSLILLALLAALVMPKDAVIERSVTIQASADQIFDHVKMFNKREAWYPWGRNDKSMKAEISENDGTVGASRSWVGDSVGEGIQTITRIVDKQTVETELKFTKPEESKVNTAISLEADGKDTKVTWAFKVPFGYPMNILIPFVKSDMDASIGPDFEKGLSLLKDILGQEAKGIFGGYQIKTVNFPGRQYLGKRDKVKFEDLTAYFSEHFPAEVGAIMGSGAQMEGMPSGLYYVYDEANGFTDMAAAIGFTGFATKEGYEVIKVPAGKAIEIDYYGPYEEADKAHYAIDDYMKFHQVTPKMPVIEEYVTDPGSEPDSKKWLTKITYLLEN